MKTHGFYGTPTYNSWRSMHDRCERPETNGYHNYGGRGISVCPEWKTFTAFLKDMGKRPEGMVIDRIDNNGNYSASNCRWVTRSQSSRNRRCVRIIYVPGETGGQRKNRVHKDWIFRNRERRNAYMKAYIQKNHAHHTITHRAWRLKNLDRRNASARKYRASHKELIAQRCRDWYRKNRKRVIKKAKEYRLKNADHVKARMREYHKNVYYPKNRSRLLAQTKAYALSHPEIRLKCRLNREAKLKAQTQ
jgi:hypothetical protein